MLRLHPNLHCLFLFQILFATGQGAGSNGGRPLPQRAAPAPQNNEIWTAPHHCRNFVSSLLTFLQAKELAATVADLFRNMLRLRLSHRTWTAVSPLPHLGLFIASSLLQAKELAATVADLLRNVLRLHLNLHRLVLCHFLSATGQGAGSTGGRPLPQRAAPASKLTPTFPVSLPYATGQETTRN
jgi:hypothetical protein